MDSILISIKKLLGITEEYTHFDSDIIMHINTVFLTLSQIGVGPTTGFSIIDESDTWDSFLPTGNKNFEAVKTYIYLKVKQIFDPPTSSVAMEAMNRTISELEWRLNSEVDFKEPVGKEDAE